MGNKASSSPVADPPATHTPDASLSSNVTTEGEGERKRRQYAHLKSAAAAGSGRSWGRRANQTTARENVIEQVYNEDFETIDHIQAVRFPPYVAKQIKDAVRNESERRCAEKEKTMARCLQDKMWTSWKCQKERDAYYYCVEDEEKRNTQPQVPQQTVDNTNSGADGSVAGATANTEGFVDLLTAYRWKFNLGVLHGEIIGRNNIMRKIWKEHFPDRQLPHPWVKDEE